MLALSDGDRVRCEPDRDELAEILLRLLKSFLDDPGPTPSEDQSRRLLSRWWVQVIEEKLESASTKAAVETRRLKAESGSSISKDRPIPQPACRPRTTENRKRPGRKGPFPGFKTYADKCDPAWETQS